MYDIIDVFWTMRAQHPDSARIRALLLTPEVLKAQGQDNSDPALLSEKGHPIRLSPVTPASLIKAHISNSLRFTAVYV